MYSLDKKERDFVSDLIEGNIKSIEFGEDNLKKFMKGILPIIKDTIEIDSSCISDIIIVNEPSVKLYFDTGSMERLNVQELAAESTANLFKYSALNVIIVLPDFAV